MGRAGNACLGRQEARPYRCSGTILPRMKEMSYVYENRLLPADGRSDDRDRSPQDDELTTFTGEMTLPAGSHLLGIGAVNMEDCYVKEMTIE